MSARVATLRRVAPLALLFFALALRLLGLDKGVWLDEYGSIREASQDDFLNALRPTGHLPLYFVLLRLWSHVGTSEPVLRIPSIVCGIGTVAVLMRWLRSRSLQASLLAGFLCATLPLMLRYSQEIRQYPLLILLEVLAFYFASQIIAEPEQRRGYVGLAISLTLAVATHLVAAMVLTIVAVFIALSPGALKRIRVPAVAISFAIPCGMFLLMYLVFLGESRERVLSNWWMPPLSMDYLLLTMDSVFGTSQLFEVAKGIAQRLGITPVLLDAVVGAGIVGYAATLAVYGEWRETFPLFGAAVLYWLEVTLYSILLTPILIYRTMLPSTIPLLAFVALQTVTIRSRALRAGCSATLILVGCIFAVVWVKREAWKPVEAWRDVAQVLAAQWEDGAAAVFFPPYAKPLVARYFPDLPQQAVAVIDPEADNAAVVATMAAVERMHRSARPVFLVVRDDAIAQQHAEVYRWLVQELNLRFGEVVQVQRFGSLSLSKYEGP